MNPNNGDADFASLLSSRRRFIAQTGVSALALSGLSGFLAACGASGSKKASANAGLRIGILTDLDTVNPLNTVDSLETHWLVYDKLMTYDKNLRPALSLATSRTPSADGKSITFKLNPKAKFHDGKALTSADVKFTYELIHSTALSFAAPYLTNLAGVDTPDDHTVVVNFTAPPPTIPLP